MNRSTAREIAVLISFSVSAEGGEPEEVMDRFFDPAHYASLAEENPVFEAFPDEASMNYIRRLVSLCTDHWIECSALIERYSHGWKPDRISSAAAAILRCALCEIRYLDDVPTGAAINEAVELAKKYENPETVSFINGVLGGYVRGEMMPEEGADPITETAEENNG